MVCSTFPFRNYLRKDVLVPTEKAKIYPIFWKIDCKSDFVLFELLKTPYVKSNQTNAAEV
jgi:hypothetical protein